MPDRFLKLSEFAPVSIADTDSIPFTRFVTMIADHTMIAPYTITPNTAGAVPGCGAIYRIIANGISTLDISAFKLVSTSGNYLNTPNCVNILIFWFDGTDYNVAITQNGTFIIPTPGTMFDTWVANLLAAGYSIPSDRQTAYLNFINTLSSNGLLDMITEMWLFEGGTAATNVIGFKNYRTGIISGTITHSVNGSTGDGSTGVMDLGLSFNDIGGGNMHIAAYLQKTNSVGADAVGVRAGFDTYISPRTSGDYFSFNDYSISVTTPPDTSGRYIMSRLSTELSVYRNGAAIGTSTISSVVNNTSIYFSAFASKDGTGGTTVDAFSDQTLGFVSLGVGLTSGQAIILDGALATLFAAIGR